MVDADSKGSGRLVVFPTTSAIYHCFIVERRTVSKKGICHSNGGVGGWGREICGI